MTPGPTVDTDVAILGGGLAGLCLAIQLKRRDPAIGVVVLERNAHPVREGAFKVGESTVEIGAHYFAHVLGLREHLDTAQIRKFGFRFFFSDGRDEVDGCTEIGVSRLLAAPSWQIDRGRFENFLAEHARSLGADFRDGAVVRRIELDGGMHEDPERAPEAGSGAGGHLLEFERGGERARLRARWLVDASGRAGLLKRRLGLAEDNDHDAHAAWWRVEGRLDPNDWSDDAEWRHRCDPPDRWRSTNHLCGPGYWVWMIPLASGAHSLGIVADPALHPPATLDSHDKAMAWLRRHQPRLARALEQGGHAVQDFRFLRRFSYGCRQVFSDRRWALTGEAGLFLDPFYSPGSDFIAIANGYICELVMHDRRGRPLASTVALYEQLYRSFYEATLSLYQGQYPLFGDTTVMPLKVIWDYTYYWSLLAPLYFADRLAAPALLGRLRDSFAAATALNTAMQALLRAWGQRNRAGDGSGDGGREDTHDGEGAPLDGRNLDQYRLGWFRELNRALADGGDDEALLARLRGNVVLMRRLAVQLLDGARAAHPGIDDHGLDALLAGVGAGEPLLPPPWYARPPEPLLPA